MTVTCGAMAPAVHHPASRPANFAWLPGCLAAQLPGCPAARRPAARLPGCPAARLPSCPAARLHGCPAQLPGKCRGYIQAFYGEALRLVPRASGTRECLDIAM